MAKVFMMCGRICSGKSTYAQKLREQYSAAVLSVDEITLALFGQDAGDMLDTYVERTEEYLYRKSTELVEMGINVVLDWGFWRKAERDYAREFYGSKGIENEFVYIDISDDEWYRRLEKRNKDISENKSDAYYVDEGLAKKFANIFEKPAPSEIDTWING
ncbi:MAG: ATP-binding protein [Oscillospiraceae bacterium]|nr:ATP-binding protein [Oscillospiraceae bacterium]